MKYLRIPLIKSQIVYVGVQNIVCVWKNENGYWVDHPDAYNAQEGDTVTLVYDGDTYSGIVINWLDKYRLEVKLDAKLRRIA